MEILRPEETDNCVNRMYAAVKKLRQRIAISAFVGYTSDIGGIAMLKRFEVENFRSFKDTVVVDFSRVGGYQFNLDCITDGLLGKTILYGRNATGKTNLRRAFGDICYVVSGRHTIDRDAVPLLNVNSSKDTARFRYEFIFDNQIVIYEYQKNRSDDLVSEKVTIDDNILFAFNFKSVQFEKLNLQLIGAESLQIDKYLDSLNSQMMGIEFDGESNTLPFLRFILNNTALAAESSLRKMQDYVFRMRATSSQNSTIIRNASLFSEYLSNDDNLKKFESFLNKMGVECKLRIVEELNDNKLLCFDMNKPVPFFKTASSGTFALAGFYARYIAMNQNPSFFFLDEFDAFFHYEMSEKLVRYFKETFPKTQILLTTHNTNLMTNYLMRPDCLLILSRDGRVTPLCDATERELREGHNLEKLYIAGEFNKYE